MNIAMFSTQPYDRQSFCDLAPAYGHEIRFLTAVLSPETALLAKDHQAVCVFVHDEVSEQVLEQLKAGGVSCVALRSAGFNHVDVIAASRIGIRLVRVPAYSPNAVAEYALALMLSLNRKVYRAYNRVRENNFSLQGLQGFDLFGKTAGIIGTGRIGASLAKILVACGCKVLGYDRNENADCVRAGVQYVSLDVLFSESDIISLHCPLLPETQYLINEAALAKMKTGVMLINTSRGALIDTRAVIDALKTGKVGYLGLDVYEEEEEIFFKDLSGTVIQDDVFARLLTFPNVIITGHQAFLTKEALSQIAHTTLENLRLLQDGKPCPNEILPEKVIKG